MTFHTLRGAVGLVLLSLLASACASAQPSARFDETAAAGLATTVAPSESSDTDIEDAAALETEVMSDGSVSDSEMERVLLAVVGCVDRSGHIAELLEFKAGEGYEFGSSAETESEMGEANAELERCAELYLPAVEELYAIQNTPTEEERAAQEERILACLTEKGNDVEGLTSFAAADEVPLQDWIACESNS